ncbi:MAG TPA: carboxypeptidase-like regulatory domain-containing protein, partial [Chitinophagaceae bacterium]|nr:carboxypeptidase-like regulatory domain-containing protein [Chitinophagaceae bacterium]
SGEENKVIPINTAKKTSFSWWKVAAMIVLVAGAALLVYQLSFTDKKNSIVQTNSKEKAEKAQINDSGKTTSSAFLNPDSVTSSVATDQQKSEEIKSELRRQESATLSKKTTDPKTADSNKDRETAISAPAIPGAPVNITEKQEKAVLNDNSGYINDDRYKNRPIAAKKEALTTRNLNTKIDDSIAGAPEQQVNNITPGLVFERNARAQSNRLFNQTNVFRGRVTDAHNNALPFSNITNTEDNIGTYSDANGYFILTSPDSVLNVQVSSVGFETNKVQLQNTASNNNVLLKEDRSSLAEVVITNKKVNSKRSRDANMVLEEAEPADGWNNYDLYLANNLKTPEDLKNKQPDIKGEVELSFEVDKNGVPYNITVKKSLCESCDKEAIRLVKEGPKWNRKAKKGKATVKIAF